MRSHLRGKDKTQDRLRVRVGHKKTSKSRSFFYFYNELTNCVIDIKSFSFLKSILLFFR